MRSSREVVVGMATRLRVSNPGMDVCLQKPNEEPHILFLG